MSQSDSEERKVPLGAIEVAPEDPATCQEIREKLAAEVAVTIYRWHPPPALADQLPPGFAFSLRCVEKGGVRRFYPVGGSFAHVGLAFTGGLAILHLLKSLTPEQRFSYRAAWLLLQRLRNSRSHLEN